MSSQRHPAEEREAQSHVWYLWSFFVVRMKGWSACVYIRVAANPPIQHGIKSWGTKPTYSLQVTCWRYTKWKTPQLSQQHFSMKSNVNAVKDIFWTDWQSSFGQSDNGSSVYILFIYLNKACRKSQKSLTPTWNCRQWLPGETLFYNQQVCISLKCSQRKTDHTILSEVVQNY